MGNISALIPILIAFLMLSNLNSTLFATSRYVILYTKFVHFHFRYKYAGARKSALPRGFSCKNKQHQTPRVSLIAQVFLAAFISFLGNLDDLISYMTYAELMDRLTVQLALLYMRYNHFQFEGKVYVNPIFVPITYLTICFFLLAIPLYQAIIY